MKVSNLHPVLVRPQFPGNIGSAVRAAKVMGLGGVYLVRPMTEINEEARSMAAGAVKDLRRIRVFPDLSEATSGAVRVYGLSARRREYRAKPVWLEDVVSEALGLSSKGKVLFLFGTERTGLENEELDRAHVLVRIKTSSSFKSINIAQAVMIVAYEVRRQAGSRIESYEYEPARSEEIESCIAAMVKALDRREFFKAGKRELAIRRLRDVVSRGLPAANEISLLRGIIRSLDEDPPRD